MTNDSGIWISSDLFSLLHPLDSIKTQLYLNVAGIKNKDQADKEYLEQLISFVSYSLLKENFVF